MIISLTHKFIFVHVPKTAGMSVANALEPYGYDPQRDERFWHRNSWRSSFFKLLNNHYNAHLAAAHLKALLPSSIFMKYFKFAFVRNPWDLQVSLYEYICSSPVHPYHAAIKGLGNFSRYVQWAADQQYIQQGAYILDEQGRSLVDFIGRYETIEDDFEEIRRRVKLDVRLPHLNRSPSRHGDYRKYYTSETAAIVAEAFKADIDTFEYAFDPQD